MVGWWEKEREMDGGEVEHRALIYSMCTQIHGPTSLLARLTANKREAPRKLPFRDASCPDLEAHHSRASRWRGVERLCRVVGGRVVQPSQASAADTYAIVCCTPVRHA